MINPITIRILIYAVTALSIAGSLFGVYAWIGSRGYNRCQAEYVIEAQEAKDNARGRIIATEEQFNEIIDDIQSQDNKNDPVGPYISHAIDEL